MIRQTKISPVTSVCQVCSDCLHRQRTLYSHRHQEPFPPAHDHAGPLRDGGIHFT